MCDPSQRVNCLANLGSRQRKVSWRSAPPVGSEKMNAFLQFPGQAEGGRPDNLEKTSFPETPPRVRVITSGNPGSPLVPTSLVLTPLERPAIGSQTDEVPTGQRGRGEGGPRRWNEREEGGEMLRRMRKRKGQLSTNNLMK